MRQGDRRDGKEIDKVKKAQRLAQIAMTAASGTREHLLRLSTSFDEAEVVMNEGLVAEADQGVALVIVMPAVTRVDQRRYVTKRHLVKYGHTDDCQASTQLAAGTHHAKVPHDDRCRDRIGELMSEDDDQRQGTSSPRG